MFDFSLDDSGGESLGDGLDSSALDLSGSSAFDDYYESDPLQGSSLSLAGTSLDVGVTDPLDDYQDVQLSGVSDPMASDIWDTGDTDTNGSGSADSTHPFSLDSVDNVHSFFSSVTKFGTSIGSLFFPGAASARPVVAGRIANVNPNRSLSAGIAGNHAALLIGVVIVAGAVIAFGGKNV
jgi:hypothetical protein